MFEKLVGEEKEGVHVVVTNLLSVGSLTFKNQSPYTDPIFLISSAIVFCNDSGDSTRALAP